MTPQCFAAAGMPGSLQTAYSMDLVLDGLSRQFPSAGYPRQSSRASNGQRGGTSMRVIKPSSANNSPRSSKLTGRRRTLIGDSFGPSKLSPSRQDHSVPPTGALKQNGEVCEFPRRQVPRPLSWHPGSYPAYSQSQVGAQPHPVRQQCQQPLCSDFDVVSIMQPPTPTTYSQYASPCADSPLSLPYSEYDSPQYWPSGSWSSIRKSQPYLAMACPSNSPNASPFDEAAHPTLYNDGNRDMNNSLPFEYHDCNECKVLTAPLTPRLLPEPQQLAPKITPDELSAFQTYKEEEDDGEVLYGMGLYDAPEKQPFEPDLYRNSMSFLGSPYAFAEPTGKGLKLEDAWEPPASIDNGDETSEECEEDSAECLDR